MGAIVKGFLVSAVLYGILGIAMGLHMAISEDHGQLPTHAHIMVIGWVSFAIFGMFYKIYAGQIQAGLAKLHFWLAQVSFPILALALWLIYSGNEVGGPVAAVSSIAYAISFLIFGLIVVKAVGNDTE